MSLLQKLFGRDNTLVIHRATLKLCSYSRSSYETAAFLERLIYFQGRKMELGQDPWVYDTREALTAHLCFSERQLRNAIAFLKDDLGVLQTQRRMITYQGKPATVTHYLVDIERVEGLIIALENDVPPSDPDPSDDPVDGHMQGEEPGAVGQSGRRASNALRESPSVNPADAYKGTKSPTKSQAKSLSSPPLRSGAPAAPEAEGGPPPPLSLAEQLRQLKARKRGGTRTPSAVHGEHVVGEAADDAERATPTVVKANAPKAPNPIAGPPSPAVPAGKKKAPKAEKAPRARDAYLDAIALACFGTTEGHPTSEWKAIQAVKTELAEVNITAEDVAAIVAWMREDRFWRDKPVIAPKSIPHQVSKWRAAQQAPTGSRGSTKVAAYLAERYGKESDLFD